MKLIRWLLVAVLGAHAAAATAQAQARDAAGQWALRAGGRILSLVELRREAEPGRWTGRWMKPERITFNDSLVAMSIGGPTVTRPLRGIARGDAIELTAAGRTAADEPTVFIFRLLSAEAAELRWRDAPMPALSLVRATDGAVIDTAWDPTRRYSLDEAPRQSNPEMTAIFEADQADRQDDSANVDGAALFARDAARRARTRVLLDAGALQSGDDYLHAAFVFQHGGEASDFLLAHTLATIAIARGRRDATWIAAATLDRYLQSIGRKQIYGTQYRSPPGQPTTQEPYDRALVSDALREALLVPPQAEQERPRPEFEAAAEDRQPRN